MSAIATSYTRVESQTDRSVNAAIERQIAVNLTHFAEHPEQIDQRLAELDREWDTERWLQLNSGILSAAGLVLAMTRGRKWLLLPLAVQGFFLQHAVQGWCPPLPVFRRLGVRTMREIEMERQGLLALRGDFDIDDPERAARMGSDGHAAGAKGDGALPATRVRVREQTSREINARIDEATARRIRYLAEHPEHAQERLQELEREWDIERILEVEGPVSTISSMTLTLGRSRAALGLPLFVQAMMILHALRGSHPLLVFLRKMGVRTASEIAAERAAVKVILGEFATVHRGAEGGSAAGGDANAALRAVIAG